MKRTMKTGANIIIDKMDEIDKNNWIETIIVLMFILAITILTLIMIIYAQQHNGTKLSPTEIRDLNNDIRDDDNLRYGIVLWIINNQNALNNAVHQHGVLK